jgi:signal transduction histidine kinase
MRTSVFGVGTRLDETKEGRGLGLAISRDLASLYGGTVELSQVQDGGLRVLPTLPLCEAG